MKIDFDSKYLFAHTRKISSWPHHLGGKVQPNLGMWAEWYWLDNSTTRRMLSSLSGEVSDMMRAQRQWT